LDNACHTIRDSTAEQLPYQSKYVELVMKCLWKMTKIIPKLIEEKSLKVNQLILEVHKFLLSSPPTEWKRRAAEKKIPQADMPLRTIKTILHELSGALEEKVFDHLDLIADPYSSHAALYLKQMVETKRRKLGRMSPVKFLSPPVEVEASIHGGMIGTPGQSRLPAPFSQYTSPAEKGVSEQELREELNLIFEKIRDKDRTKIGIQELYQFKKMHSDVDTLVDEFVNSTGL
jgi:cytoskeleton-associated protein 5